MYSINSSIKSEMMRLKPYTTNQTTWSAILSKSLTIPMNQREYSWNDDNINAFLDDIVAIFDENKYCEKMGSIINLKWNGQNHIYDGQQRILTTILILIVIARLSSSEKVKSKIMQLLAVDPDIDELSYEQMKIKEKYEVKDIPKIFCMNPHDMEGLIDIFNGEEEQENKTKSKRKLINVKKCQTKLIPAYHLINDYFNRYLSERPHQDDILLRLYKFIVNDIDIQYYDSDDRLYVTRIFNWENNRGKTVDKLVIIKNLILSKISDDKKLDIYEKWEKLRKRHHHSFTNFGEKVFDVAIQILNNKIDRTIDHDRTFQYTIYSNDVYKCVMKFFKVVERLHEIMNDIDNDKFGRLLCMKTTSLNWEGYMWCLLPIFYTTSCVDIKLIHLFCKWHIRNLPFNVRNFNNLAYSSEFIRISNEVLNNHSYDYFKEIELCLHKNKDMKVKDNAYEDSMNTYTAKTNNKPKLLYLFLETVVNTDDHNVSIDLSLEHIYCKNDSSKLMDTNKIGHIGNLTLLENKNSKNNHKGNKSLGAKSFSVKRKSYAESSSKLTREIAGNFETFNETDITTRGSEVISLLNEYTDY